MNAPIHSNDWEMLSAYLDGQMTESEQRRVRDLLARSDELRAGLEELRRTRAVLRAAPRRRVPHNFTLTPAMARKARPRFWWGWAPSFGVASALATVVLGLTLFFQLSPAGTRALSLPAAAPLNTPGQSAQESAPPIIIWNGNARGNAFEGAGAGPGTAPLHAPDQPAVTTALATDPTAPADAAPRTAIVQPTETPLPGQALKSASQPTPNAEAATSSGPILGVASTEDRGKMFVPTLANPDQYSVRAISTPVVSGFSPVQIALAAFALATGLAALILWRRSRS
jgi:hypothetical protein